MNEIGICYFSPTSLEYQILVRMQKVPIAVSTNTSAFYGHMLVVLELQTPKTKLSSYSTAANHTAL